MAPKAKTVCVIGAGVSGVVSAVHLRAAGLEVVVFERYSTAGGVWVYDERKPPEPPYPSMRPSEADFTALMSQEEWLSRETKLGVRRREEVDVEIWHAPPGPCYDQLTNNVPTGLMELKINSWKPNTAPNVNNRIVCDYIQDTAAKYDIPKCTQYNTRVEHVSKEKGIWRVETSSLADRGYGASKKTQIWEFNFLVVATGHYHACRVPDIPGLKKWKTSWPNRVKHSKGYRTPREYENQCHEMIFYRDPLERDIIWLTIQQTVLLVGASVSSTDIARELGPFAKKIYQVSRGGLFDLPSSWLPENAIRIGEIASFNDDFNSSPTGHDPEPILKDNKPIPNTITLVNGDLIHGIDSVLLCTGYHMSFPFLRKYHQDFVAPEDAGDEVIVTDGTQMHNLHKDIFYIPDTTLAFIGVPYHIATFSLFEYQAMAVAALFSGKAKLPALTELKEEYRQRRVKKGSGKAFHSLKHGEVEYVDSLVEWINANGIKFGGNALQGHSQEWKLSKEELLERIKSR